MEIVEETESVSEKTLPKITCQLDNATMPHSESDQLHVSPNTSKPFEIVTQVEMLPDQIPSKFSSELKSETHLTKCSDQSPQMPNCNLDGGTHLVTSNDSLSPKLGTVLESKNEPPVLCNSLSPINNSSSDITTQPNSATDETRTGTISDATKWSHSTGCQSSSQNNTQTEATRQCRRNDENPESEEIVDSFASSDNQDQEVKGLDFGEEDDANELNATFTSNGDNKSDNQVGDSPLLIAEACTKTSTIFKEPELVRLPSENQSCEFKVRRVTDDSALSKLDKSKLEAPSKLQDIDTCNVAMVATQNFHCNIALVAKADSSSHKDIAHEEQNREIQIIACDKQSYVAPLKTDAEPSMQVTTAPDHKEVSEKGSDDEESCLESECSKLIIDTEYGLVEESQQARTEKKTCSELEEKVCAAPQEPRHPVSKIRAVFKATTNTAEHGKLSEREKGSHTESEESEVDEEKRSIRETEAALRFLSGSFNSSTQSFYSVSEQQSDIENLFERGDEEQLCEGGEVKLKRKETIFFEVDTTKLPCASAVLEEVSAQPGTECQSQEIASQGKEMDTGISSEGKEMDSGISSEGSDVSSQEKDRSASGKDKDVVYGPHAEPEASSEETLETLLRIEEQCASIQSTIIVRSDCETNKENNKVKILFHSRKN